MCRYKLIFRSIKRALNDNQALGTELAQHALSSDRILPLFIPLAPYQKRLALIEGGGTVGIKSVEGNGLKLKKLTISGPDTAILIDRRSDKLDFESTNDEKVKYMALNLDKVIIKKVKKGVVAPDTYDINVRRTTFEDMDVAFDIYVTQSEVQKLGLPEDTPTELVCEALQIVRQSTCNDSMIDKLSESRLINWLGIASNSVTITTPIVAALMSYLSS